MLRTYLNSPRPLPGPVLVTGADGMLGSDLVGIFGAALAPDHVVGLGRHRLDITSPESIRQTLSSLRPAIVLNAAAYTNVDGAESDRERAHAINAAGVRWLTEYCFEYKAKLVHFSTDQVFDGTGSSPRREDEEPHPLNWYAETKWMGEREALRVPQNLCLRVQWLYGRKKDRFTPLRGKEVFTPFQDQVGAPTWTRDVAETLVALLEREASGLFHFAYDDHASWFQVYEFVKAELGLSTLLIPKLTEEVKLPARRPLFSALSNEKLRRTLGVERLGSWRDSLREFLHSSPHS